uniref:PIN domain-containing protein n=1 Tax=Candidatus Methanogaster sp. ANME-2c ERB4 TaxID=2759911 RepID=A0A7G9Y982_9EURY|nr:hypothetical protein KKOBALHG_00003 [Methanosarcinales archaeon ANME-2c ERB4]QNO45097.1 hypothetical protein HICMJNBA_00003 [Methanosarcinales archaeon ANME-2c ERB4]
MKKAKVYLDTTVPSAYYDDRAPDRERLTRIFWIERLPDFKSVISNIVLSEVRDTPDEEKRTKMGRLLQGIETLIFDEEADELAAEYLRRGVIPERYADDANHVAIAVVNGVRYLVSWNFKHIVRVSTRREVNLINALMGYESIELIAPPEL